VAVKKVSNAFSNAVDARRTLREMALMRHLRHDNVAPLRDVLTTGDDVYLVYELMDTDLHRICRSPQALSDEHISFFLYQALRGLKYVHSAGVMHRDLKPSNLLVNANCDLKLCDFGLARACVAPEASSARALRLTEYVVTRWYRAPELLLSCPSYSQSVDVWSAGCILAELLGRRPLFPGRDYIQQLNLQLRVLGTPREEDLAHVTNVHARRYVRSMPDMPPVALQALFPKSNPLALDLLAKMLVFVPSKRLTVKQALEHPYLAKLHDVMDEPTYANSAPPPWCCRRRLGGCLAHAGAVFRRDGHHARVRQRRPHR
jgi:serine/threonine protein kinase